MISIEKIKTSKAIELEAQELTKIAFAAKRHWNYPEHYFNIWKEELTITDQYIQANSVFKAIYKNKIIGFYSIIENKLDFYSGEVYVNKGFWLEHIFVLPDYHKHGIGYMLIDHAKQVAKGLGTSNLFIFVDPFARGFYDKIGAEYLYDSKSSIEGRMIPVYNLKT